MAEEGTAQKGLVFYKQLRSMFDDLKVGVFTVDSQRRITSFNRMVQTLTGHKEEDVIGRFCYEIFQNDLCQGVCKYHEAVEAEQTALNFDVEIFDIHGDRHMITKIVTPLYDAGGELTGCIEIFQDHSAFEDLINRVRYDERRLKIILDNLDIGIFTVTRSGDINFFNTLAESIFGYDRREMLGKSCSVLLGGEESDGVVSLTKCVADGKPRSNRKLTITTKNGAAIPVRVNYMALRNEAGRIMGGLATIQDLSLIHELNRAIHSRYTFGDMIGKSPAIKKIFEIVPVIATSDATVLIEGPTGTGKDLLAKVIHNASSRAQKPLVKVNCAALPDNLLESEMFGYVRGAFTGADRDKPGRFQEADGGTIFLDEIGDLPLSLQAKLLRVLEEKEFYPLGSRRTTKVNVRIIAATNQGLERQVEEKKFREDLFYRLNVMRLDLPPLIERDGDVPLLIDHILRRLNALKGKQVNMISENAMEILLNHDYPGNVRELENILEHALIICQHDTIKRRHLPLSLQKRPAARVQAEGYPSESETGAMAAEKKRIARVLKRHQWHRGRTARELGIDRTTLWRKIKKYKLTP